MDSNIQTLVFKAKQGDNSAFSTCIRYIILK